MAACARGWTTRVVDLRGLDPLFDAPSLNCVHGGWAGGVAAGARAGRRGQRGRRGAAVATSPRHAVRGRRLRGLLLVAPPRDEPRTDVPAGRRAAAAELAAPAGGLSRARGNGGAERHAGAAAERAAARAGVRSQPAARHRARGGLRDRHPQHDGRAGAGRAGARPRVRHGARERLVGARHPGVGVPAARAVPGQVVRHVGEPLGGAARRAGRSARRRARRRSRRRCRISPRSPGLTTSH